jgi:nitronate monooxygenase
LHGAGAECKRGRHASRIANSARRHHGDANRSTICGTSAALRKAHGTDTVVTTIYSGLPARVIANRFTRALRDAQADVVAFPLGMAAVAPLVGASLKAGSSDIAPLWAGQGVELGQSTSAGELVARLSAAALA